MNTLQFTHDTVRMLGVHGLCVYMLMRCAEAEELVPITHQWIFDHMPGKTSVNTVTAELRRLTSDERQIAIRVKGGWRLNLENAFQLPLEYLLENQNLSERDSGATTTTTIEERKQDKSVVVVKDTRISQREILVNYETPGVTFEGNLKACRECHIGHPTASAIAAMPWVSPDFIKAHVESLYASDVIGLAIRRIEGNELPRLWLEPKPAARNELDSKIARLRARDEDESDE